ncbi:MAG: Ig-like domain-containing protein [Candidatus Paceibacterota bacterium]|jgi:uncharacterized protein YjdB
MKKIYITTLSIVTALSLSLSLVPAGIAHAALQAVSRDALGAVSVSTATGFPVWYQDVTGTALQQCLGLNADGTGAADPKCILPTANPIPDINANPAGFPDESFYSFAEAPLTINGNAGRFRLLTEAAFVNLIPVNGEQLTFTRASLFTSQQGAFPANSTFHVEYPFGAFDFSTDALGDFVSIPGSGPFGANAKEMRAEDGPGAAGDFVTLLAGANTGITTFLRSTTAPVGYLGDAVTETPVTGGTNGNIVTITQTAGVGPFVVTGGTNWVVAGKIAVIDTIAPVITAAPMSAALGTANAVASVGITDNLFVGSATIDLGALSNNFSATLNGAQEVPATVSGATGSGTFTIDTAANTLSFNITSNVTGVTGMHIHGSDIPPNGAAGQNAAIAFDLGTALPAVGTWTYPEAMEAEILAGRTYVNIHTTLFPNGIIRGQILPTTDIQPLTLTAGVNTNGTWGVVLPALNRLGTFNLPIAVSDGSNTATSNLVLTVNTLASVSVAPATATIVGAGTQQLTASPLDNNGTAFVGATVTWASNNTAVATVDANGLVTGVLSQTPGTATITATAVSGATSVTGSSVISVSPGLPVLTGVAVTPSPASIVVNAAAPAGTTLQLSAAPVDQFGVPFVGTTVTWASSDSLVATVDANGLVTSVIPGVATITATASDGALVPTVVTGTSVVTITTAPQVFTSVSVTPATATITSGTQQLTATGIDQFGGPMATQPAFTWASSNPAVATVDATGLVTAVGAGSATITATSGALNGTSVITVTAVTTTDTITPATASVVLNATTQLSASTLDQFGAVITPAPAIVWTSSNPLVATVDANGLVTGVALGTANINAASGALISASATVTVVAVPQVLTSVAVTPATASIITGATQQFTASALDQFGSPMIPQPVFTWTSSDAAIATVNASGMATGVIPGAVTITATNGAFSGTAALTVTLSPAVLTSVSVTPATASVLVGATQQLTAALLDQRNDPFTSVASTTWVSSNPLIATVDANGLVTGVAVGTATITATNGAVSGQVAVTVPSVLLAAEIQATIGGGGGGIFTLPALTPATSTPSVTLALPLKIDMPSSDGTSTSTVSMPSGTVITKVDGTNLDATTLSASAAAAASLSNLGDVVVNGSVQWGIPNIGLQFSQPISLSIFVGTGLNGQVVDIRRSVDGTSDWTSDGIVTATSTVANGFANFQATKASFFAATTPAPAPAPASSGGGGRRGGGGSISFASPTASSPIAQATPTAPAQGQVLGAAVFIFTKNLSVGMHEAEVTELQKFLIDNGFSIPAGATGFFGAQTKAAVIKFQKDHGVIQTGFFGPLTRGEANRGRGSGSSGSSGSGRSSGLSSAQVDSIIAVLQSFGADQSTVTQVRLALGK